MGFVLDASVTLAWCLPDESSDYAVSILHRFKEHSAIVPPIWPQEVANALVVGMRRGRISDRQVAVATQLLQELPIEIDQPLLTRTFDGVVSIAVKQRLSVYDASYLELAKRLQCSLATADAKLSQAARAVDIELV